MASHRDTHPAHVEGCFGCKALTLSVATLKIRHGANPVQRVTVIADDGPRAGRVAGEHTVHWDGRQDATVRPPTVAVRAAVHEIE